MSQPNQANNPDSSGDVPLKRKRGRPRKYPRPDLEESPYIPNDQNINQNPVSGEHAQVPPGFGAVNGNQPRQKEENGSDGVTVGRAVSGVIEAVFDAGYLLCVKVENSDIMLRGLVFKPGRYVPITAENDVAPGVPMIQRNEVPFPTVTSTHVQHAQPKARNEQIVNAYRNETETTNALPATGQVPRAAVGPNNLVASQLNKVSSVAEQTANPLARGNMVPLVIQPANISNGVPVSNQLSQVITQASLPSGSNVPNEIPVVGNQASSSQIGMLVRGIQHEVGPHHQPSFGVLDAEEERSLKLAPNIPFENLVTEAMKSIQTPALTVDSTLVKHSSRGLQGQANENMNQQLLITPLQAAQSGNREHSISASKPMDNDKSGKMTELFQDNTMENQGQRVELLGPGNKLNDLRNSETELGDGETGQSANLSLA